MTERYTLSRDGVWISNATGKPMVTRDGVYLPSIVRDVSYMSPLSRKMVTSRSQRREEMKQHNVRELDPSEYKPTYREKKNAVAMGGEWNPDAGKRTADDDGYKRLSRDDLPARIAETLKKGVA